MKFNEEDFSTKTINSVVIDAEKVIASIISLKLELDTLQMYYVEKGYPEPHDVVNDMYKAFNRQFKDIQFVFLRSGGQLPFVDTPSFNDLKIDYPKG